MEDGRLGVPTKLLCVDDGTLKATLTEWRKVADTGVVEYTVATPMANFQMGLNAMYTESMTNFDYIDAYFAAVRDKSKIFEH